MPIDKAMLHSYTRAYARDPHSSRRGRPTAGLLSAVSYLPEIYTPLPCVKELRTPNQITLLGVRIALVLV